MTLFIPQSPFKGRLVDGLETVNNGHIQLQPINHWILCNWSSWFMHVQRGW